MPPHPHHPIVGVATRSGWRTSRTTSPTYGPVTVVIVTEPSQAGDDRRCQATPLTAPRLIRAWKRRRGMAHDCRPLTPLWATAACHVPGEEAYDGPLGWRLLAGLVLHRPQALERARHDGCNRLQPDASLVLPSLKRPGVTRTFLGPQAGCRMNASSNHPAEKSVSNTARHI